MAGLLSSADPGCSRGTDRDARADALTDGALHAAGTCASATCLQLVLASDAAAAVSIVRITAATSSLHATLRCSRVRFAFASATSATDVQLSTSTRGHATTRAPADEQPHAGAAAVHSGRMAASAVLSAAGASESAPTADSATALQRQPVSLPVSSSTGQCRRGESVLSTNLRASLSAGQPVATGSDHRHTEELGQQCHAAVRTPDCTLRRSLLRSDHYFSRRSLRCKIISRLEWTPSANTEDASSSAGAGEEGDTYEERQGGEQQQ
jgi:hypothetical protein